MTGDTTKCVGGRCDARAERRCMRTTTCLAAAVSVEVCCSTTQTRRTVVKGRRVGVWWTCEHARVVVKGRHRSRSCVVAAERGNRTQCGTAAAHVRASTARGVHAIYACTRVQQRHILQRGTKGEASSTYLRSPLPAELRHSISFRLHPTLPGAVDVVGARMGRVSASTARRRGALGVRQREAAAMALCGASKGKQERLHTARFSSPNEVVDW
jgi:hypothetical protein